MWMSSAPAPCFEKMAALYCLRFVKDEWTICMGFCFWVLCSVGLSTFAGPHCIDYCSFTVSKSWKVVVSVLQLCSSPSILLAYLSLLLLRINFRISLLLYTESFVGIFIWIVLNPWMELGRTDILTVLSPPVHEQGISALIQFFDFFCKSDIVFLYGSCTYFILYLSVSFWGY